jgi:hypothetical protein
MALPEYRKPAATIRIDGATFGGMITGQMISPSALPDPVNEYVQESVPLRGGIAEVEAMIKSAQTQDRDTDAGSRGKALAPHGPGRRTAHEP